MEHSKFLEDLRTSTLLRDCRAWLHSRPSPRYFPSSWPDTAPLSLLAFDATGKSLPRWRLAMAQEAARGTLLRLLFLCGNFSFSFLMFADWCRTEFIWAPHWVISVPNIWHFNLWRSMIFTQIRPRVCIRDTPVNARTWSHLGANTDIPLHQEGSHEFALSRVSTRQSWVRFQRTSCWVWLCVTTKDSRSRRLLCFLLLRCVFLATYHLDGRMDLSVETAMDSNRRHVPESISSRVTTGGWGIQTWPPVRTIYKRVPTLQTQQNHGGAGAMTSRSNRRKPWDTSSAPKIFAASSWRTWRTNLEALRNSGYFGLLGKSEAPLPHQKRVCN